MKNFPYILLLAIIGYILYTRNPPVDIRPYQDKIDSLDIYIQKDKILIERLKKQAETQDLEQDKYIATADSLRLLLKVPKPCVEVVEIQEKEIVALRDGLSSCIKAKRIYVKTIGICQETVIKHETRILTQEELSHSLQKNLKRDKRKLFLLGSGTTLLIVATILLLL